MRELLSDLDRWTAEGVAMATLVRIRGSAPRLPGARLICTADGAMSGSVSAGCVESDVFERALQVLAEGRPALANYGIADESAFAVGLSCGGSIDVLIEPFVGDEVWGALREGVELRRPVCLAVALGPDDLLGRRFCIDSDGNRVGSIDDSIDAELEVEARALVAGGEAKVVTVLRDGAQVEVFVEPLLPPRRLYLIGANHIAIPLCRMAKTMGYEVIVIDPRSVFATRERLPEADELLHAWPVEVLDEVRLDPFSYLVTLTHDPKFDIPALAIGIRSRARYIGALGSRRTHAARLAKLAEDGFSESELARIHSPVGLDLGGRGPEEIALSILSEMQAVRCGRGGKTLEVREVPSHGDGS